MVGGSIVVSASVGGSGRKGEVVVWLALVCMGVVVW